MGDLGPTREATGWNKRSCGWAQASRGRFATVSHSCEKGMWWKGSERLFRIPHAKEASRRRVLILKIPSDRVRRWVRKLAV